MSKLSEQLTAAVHAAGLRTTPQRYAILEHLARRSVHATAEEIFVAVNRRDPRASRATVYNCLRSLERAGLVREVVSEGKAARYDAALRPHHHFVCEHCGEVEDIDWFDLPPALLAAALRGRAVKRCDIVFRGACEACAARGVNR